MRTIIIEGNEKLIGLLKMKAELNDKWIELDKQKVSIEEEQNKLALKINRLNDKAQPMYRDIIKDIETFEFEEHEKMFLDPEDGKLKINIVDKLEDFKEFYRQKKEELLKKQNESRADKNTDTKPTE